MTDAHAALAAYVALFALVTGLGFLAARWRRPATLASLDEWGLGGRRLGTWVTWFLIGGDFYTAYTIIAVPALVYARGAYGFFALPYTVIVYPIVYAVMPRLWAYAAQGGHVTAADTVRARYGLRGLELAVASTSVLATMPYVALQLIGMRTTLTALGLGGEWPLMTAFAILAAYTYSAGLRAPAMIAFVKDVAITVVVVAAVAAIPSRLGGYGHVFASTAADFAHPPSPGATQGHLLLAPGEATPFATLALGSALAAFLYPHTLTGILAASGPDTIRRNAVMLPAYTALLGLVAMMGYMAHAAHVRTGGAGVVPALLLALFPGWFSGFALGAIAVGALVPAAVMSIGAANLFARNIWRVYFQTGATAAQEARVARIASLVVKVGALACILSLPARLAIDFQLLGGVWILQVLPAVVFGLYTTWYRGGPLLLGWAGGMVAGTNAAWRDHLDMAHDMVFGGLHAKVYTGLLALALNVALATAANVILPRRKLMPAI